MEYLNSQGLCYLRLFSFLSPQEIKTVKAQLGLYPEMQRVMRVWYTYVHRREPSLWLLPTVGTNGLLHCESECMVSENNRKPGRVYLTAKEFFSMYVRCALRVGGDDGFCYTVWLQEAGFSSLQIAHTKVQLGRYPYVTDVMSMIMNHADPMSVFLSVPTLVGVRLLHVQPNDRTLMFDIMWADSYRNCRVGGDTHPAEDMVDALSATIALKNAGIDMETMARQALMREMSLPSSTLRSALIDEKLAHARSLVNNNNERLQIKYRLTDLQRVDLVSAYPNFSLQFSNHPAVHPHALSAAARVCETQEALTMLHYSSAGYQQGSVVLVKDIGGNPVTHLQRRRFNVHCCCPILDVRDAERDTNRRLAIQDMIAKENNRTRKTKLQTAISDDFSRRMLWCDRKGQDCALRARSCMFIHSTYDMSIRDIANTLVSAHADTGVITVLYAPEVFTETRGVLRYQQCSWELTKHNTVIFSFLNDSSWTYEHSKETYLGLFGTNVLVADNGVIFTTEIVKIKLDVAFIKVTRIQSSVKCATKLRRVLYFQDPEPRIVLQSYAQCAPNEFHRRWHFKRTRLIVSQYFYNQVKSYALSLTAARFNLHQVYDYARSVNGTVVINGVSVTHRDALPADDLHNAVAAIFVICFQERWAVSQITKDLTDLLVKKRTNVSTWWDLITGKVKTLIADFMYGGECTGDCEHTSTFLSNLWVWLSGPEYKCDVTAMKWGEPIAVETYIPPVEMWHTSPGSLVDTMLKQYRSHEVVDPEVMVGALEDGLKQKFANQESLTGGAVLDRVDCTIDEHTCLHKYSASSRHCFEELMEVDVPGDGACMYYALLMVLHLQIEVKHLKQQLLRSKYLPGLCQREEAIRTLKADDWGNDSILALVCFEFNVTICVHLGDDDKPSTHMVLSTTRQPGANQTLHLRLRKSHYTALMPLNKKPVPSSRDIVGFVTQVIPEKLRPFVLISAADKDLKTLLEAAAIASVGDVEVTAGSRECLVEVIRGECTIVSGSQWCVAWKVLENTLYSAVNAAKTRHWDVSHALTKLDLCRNRAAYKILELCAGAGVTLRDKSVLEIGGAPGAFALLVASITRRYHCVTRPDFRCYNELAGIKQFTAEYTTVEKYNQQPCTQRYDVVIGDVGTDTSYTWDESHLLFLQQLNTAVQRLESGGLAIVKHANLYACMHFWSQYRTIMDSKFVSVNIVKPNSAHSLSTEVYVVLSEFCGGDDHQNTEYDTESHLDSLTYALQVYNYDVAPDKQSLKEQADRYKAFLHTITADHNAVKPRVFQSHSVSEFLNTEKLGWSAIISMDYGGESSSGVAAVVTLQPQPGWKMVRGDADKTPEKTEKLEETARDDVQTSNVETCNVVAKTPQANQQDGSDDVDDLDEKLRSGGMDRTSSDCAVIHRELDACSVLSGTPTSVENWSMSMEDDDPSHHCEAHDQIMLDAERDFASMDYEIHRSACKFFAMRPELLYAQGVLGYFAIAMELYTDEKLVHYCVDRMFAGDLRKLLSSRLEYRRPTSKAMRIILNSKTKLTEEETDYWFSLWQKVVNAGARHFVEGFGKPELESFVSLVFLHDESAFVPVMRAAYSHNSDPMQWCETSYYYDWCKQMGATTRWNLYNTFLKRKTLCIQSPPTSPSIPEKLVKATHQACKRMFTDFMVKRSGVAPAGGNDIPRIAATTTGNVVSTVSVGGVMLRHMTFERKRSPNYTSGDCIDIELNRRANQPLQDVKKSKAMQHPTLRETIPAYVSERLNSNRPDLKCLKQDIISDRDSLVSVVEKSSLVRDLFCVVLNVDNMKQSIVSYAWAPFVRSVHPDSLDKAVREQVRPSQTSGEYLVIDMKQFGTDVSGLLVVMLSTPSAIELDLCSFAKLIRADLPVAKQVYLAQPEPSFMVSCKTTHTLIQQSVQLSDPHRWVRVVERLCVDCDEIIQEQRRDFVENPQVRAAQLLQRNWAQHGVRDAFYKYEPVYYGEASAEQRIRTAVSEITEFWRVGDSLTMKRLADQYKQIRFPMTKVATNLMADSAEGFAVWDILMGKWHCKHVSKQCEKYEYCFDGVKLVYWGDRILDMNECASRYVLVSADSALMQDRKLYEATMKAIPDLPSVKLNDFTIHLVSGVPGCGKTTKAIKNFVVADDKNPLGDLILFPTKVASLDFRVRLMKHTSSMIKSDYLQMHVMTVDSFLINDRKYPKYKKLIIDEALMLHAGCIFTAAIKAGVKTIYLIGDVKQIPWVNRTSLPVKYQSIVRIVQPAEILSVSYRCTLSTAAVLSGLYQGGMTAAGRTVGDMSVRVTPNPLAIKLEPHIQYLTYTQADKLELQKRAPAGKEVNTIHEFQGKESDVVCLVRGSTKKHEIYTREEHNLVAISRHKKQFIYVTPTCDGDVMCSWIAKVRHATADTLRKYQALSGGYLPTDIVMRRYPTKGLNEYDSNVLSCSVKWGIPNVSSAFPERIVIDDVNPATKLLSNNAHTSVTKFQAYYDLLFPGNSCYDLRFLPEIVAHSPLELHMENTRLNPAYRNPSKPKRFANLRPVMRTSMAVNRPVNQIETLLGMVKRNQAAPKLAGKIDWDQMADVLLKCFEDTFVREDCRDIWAGYPTDPIQCDPSAIEDWLTKQTGSTLASIERDLPPHEAKLTSYQYMIKNKVKPQLDCGAPFTYSAVQTIAYQRKNINALFCPIFKYMRRRLTPIMKTKFKIFTDMSHEEFALEIERDVGASVFLTDNFLEVDISKYDKSQSEVVLIFECNLMRKLGVPEYWVGLWWNAHCQTTLSDKNAQVSCNVEFQRKSGDASTFFGNTVFLMALLSSLYDLSKVDFACFAGDDSILIGGDELCVDFSFQCANIFNLEAKFMRNWKYMSFCSKFFIVLDTKLYLVPDPVKLLTKLGRHDVVNWEHLEEYRVSMRDMTSQYSDGKISSALARAVSDRYNCAVDFSSMIESLYALSGDYEVLKTFFYSEPYDVLCNDPTRSSFD